MDKARFPRARFRARGKLHKCISLYLFLYDAHAHDFALHVDMVSTNTEVLLFLLLRHHKI